MIVTAGTTFPLIEEMAAPQKLNASLGITFFYTKHVMNRYATFEFGMSRRIAFEYIQTFVRINHKIKFKELAETLNQNYTNNFFINQ